MARRMPVLKFKGLANASAAVALDGRHFVLADDEESALFLYDFDDPDRGPQLISLDAGLGTGAGEPDLEGAAMLGGRIWWITSHHLADCNTAARQMLFVTDVERSGGGISIKVGGAVCRTLLRDLARKPAIAAALDFAGKGWDAIDIEGLAGTPEGGLMLGFRAPLHGKHAIIVKIRNAATLPDGEPPDLADPILVKLGGRGIRSLEEIEGGYLIVGGPRDGGSKSKLFFWSGRRHDDPVSLDAKLPRTFNPEAVFQIPDTSTTFILSDDGRRYRGGDRPPGPTHFRALLVDLAELMRDIGPGLHSS